MAHSPFAPWRSRTSYIVAGGLAFAIAACGGRSPEGTAPTATARETVTSFMRAVTDSNLTKMAELWGSAKGPAARTRQPGDYERRIVLMQSFLRHDDYRITADASEAKDRRGLQVELRRQACTWIVPFTVVRSTQDGWIVSGVDLTRAGNPARPCDPNARRDSTVQE